MISRHRSHQNPAPAQPASPSPSPPRRRRKTQNPWVMPWILQREERGCYRTVLDELITIDIPGYRNFTRMELAFLCQLTCQSADIMSSLCGVGVRVRVCARVNNFFSKTTRPRDMLFFFKRYLIYRG